jgi:hypothetical protein
MKKTAAIQITIAMLMLAATAAWGADPPDVNIAATPHNLSVTSLATGTYKSSNVKEICVFCHTPHTAYINRALWNRSNPEAGLAYHMYTSGVDLSSVTKNVTAPKPESLMCLSCHDGRTALNVVHQTSMKPPMATPVVVNGQTLYQLDINGTAVSGMNPGLPAPDGYRMGDFGPGGGSFITENNANLGAVRNYDQYGNFVDDGNIFSPYAGTEFADDHPISMSFTNAYAARLSMHPGNPGLVDPGNAANYGTGKRLDLIKFYGPDKRVECGSCHDPHVAYNYQGLAGKAEDAPFLRKSNVASALCLSCHDK